MRPEELQFEAIRERFCAKETSITPGRMMSSPAITYQGKVFTFLSKNYHMVFKLGKGFDPSSSVINGIAVFNPFKNKGPLTGWYQVPFEAQEHWEALSTQALEVIKKAK